MSRRWRAFYIPKIWVQSREGGVLILCSKATGARAALEFLQHASSIMISLKAIMRRNSLKEQTYIVAMAMSLSERLSLVDLGAAGNSISNLGSFDIVPACLGKKKVLRKAY